MKRNKMKIIIPKESKLDLNSLSESLDTALKNETKESLTEWLNSKRKETILEESDEKLYKMENTKNEQQCVINRIYLWIISFGLLCDGLIGVLTIGFIRTKIGLYSASKYARWKHRVKYGL